MRHGPQLTPQLSAKHAAVLIPLKLRTYLYLKETFGSVDLV